VNVLELEDDLAVVLYRVDVLLEDVGLVPIRRVPSASKISTANATSVIVPVRGT